MILSKAFSLPICLGVLFAFSAYPLEASADSGKNDEVYKHKAISIFGTWELTKDDEKVGEAVPKETLSFYNNGALIVDTGKKVYRGIFKMNAEKIVMIVPAEGFEISMERNYFLDGDGLHLANTKKGFTHYARKKIPIRPYDFMKGWKKNAKDRFQVQTPPGWVVLTEPANAKGHQRLQIANSSATKSVTLVVTPFVPKEKIEIFGKKMVENFLLQGKTVGSVHHVKESELYSIKGSVYHGEAQLPDGTRLTLKAVVTPWRENVFVAVYFYLVDQLNELGHITRSLRVDGCSIRQTP